MCGGLGKELDADLGIIDVEAKEGLVDHSVAEADDFSEKTEFGIGEGVGFGADDDVKCSVFGKLVVGADLLIGDFSVCVYVGDVVGVCFLYAFFDGVAFALVSVVVDDFELSDFFFGSFEFGKGVVGTAVVDGNDLV